MAASVLKQGMTKELKKLMAQLSGAMAETLGSLIARELTAKPGDLRLTTAEDLLAELERPCAVVRGALDKDLAGKTLYAMFSVQDATAMAGMLMMTPDEIIEQRRKGNVLDGEDHEAFGELGNVLCSGLGNVLRDQLGNVDLRLHDHGIVKPSLDEAGLLPGGPLVALELELKVANLPPTRARLLVDRDTAELWNKQPLDGKAGAAPAVVAKAAPAAPRQEHVANRIEEDSLEDIPAAPIRGVLNAFVTTPELHRLVRRGCRRIGFELRRYGRNEIPNPAAHRNEVILVDVPLVEDRRFDWCRRIKEYDANIKILLLLHRPSRARVTRAFLSKADSILGWPCEEAELGQKLQDLLGDAQPPADAE